jgi:hypothetical protein
MTTPIIKAFDVINGARGVDAPYVAGVLADTPQTLTQANIQLDTGTKTATATAGAATLNKASGVITSEALTTAAGATYALTLTNSDIVLGDMVLASVQNGTSTTGTPCVTTVAVSAGQVIVTIQNIHASAALNGTIKITFAVLKA